MNDKQPFLRLDSQHSLMSSESQFICLCPNTDHVTGPTAPFPCWFLPYSFFFVSSTFFFLLIFTAPHVCKSMPFIFFMCTLNRSATCFLYYELYYVGYSLFLVFNYLVYSKFYFSAVRSSRLARIAR